MSPQTLAGPVGIGACQLRHIATRRQTVQTLAPAAATTTTGRSSREPPTVTKAPASAGVA